MAMDPPPTEAALSERRRRRRGGARSVELTLIFTILFVIVSLLKLEPLARNSVQVDNNKKSIDLPQTNQLDFDYVTASASCIKVIESLKPSSGIMWMWPQAQAPEAVSEIIKSMVKGDYVEVDSGNDCHQVGSASLAAAINQRAVQKNASCDPQKRAIWLVLEDEDCVNEVSKRFEENNFAILDETNPAAAMDREDIDVPIFLLKGMKKTSLADSKIRDIAVLRFSKSVESYENTLFALFAFYRRVRLNGYVISDQYNHDDVSPHMRAMEVFFTDVTNNSFVSHFCGTCPYENTSFDCNARVEYLKKSYDTSDKEAVKDLLSKGFCVHPQFNLHKRDRKNSTNGSGTLFQKNDTRVRVPKDFRKQEIVPIIDPKVTKSWEQLNEWHSKTVRKYFGHVGTNPYQTYRYIEAVQHMIQHKQQLEQNEVRVNVCETGFNGGHSAMLFLSFLDLEKGIKVYYYGWDLKEVGSSLPTAEKMDREFGDHFHIVWGDSKVTLKNARETMNGQKCDLIVVDGEHSRNGVVNDLQNLLKVAEKGAIVFGDDCAPYKRTVPKSEEMLDGWNSFVKTGDLVSVAMYRNPDLGSPGFVEGIVPESNGEYTLGL